MAALVAQFQRHLVGRCGCGQVLGGVEAVVIDLDIAEKLVMLFLARWQIQCIQGHGRVGALELDPFPVQVIVVGNLEIEPDRAAVDRHGFDPECLFDRQQIVGVGREGVAGQQGE